MKIKTISGEDVEVIARHSAYTVLVRYDDGRETLYPIENLRGDNSIIKRVKEMPYENN